MISCNQKRNSQFGKTEKSYYANGQLKSLKEFKDNHSWKNTQYFENGRVSSVANYYQGHFVGKVISFYPDGKKNFEQEYDSIGKSDGAFRLWDERGQLKQEGIYKDGKISSLHQGSE